MFCLSRSTRWAIKPCKPDPDHSGACNWQRKIGHETRSWFPEWKQLLRSSSQTYEFPVTVQVSKNCRLLKKIVRPALREAAPRLSTLHWFCLRGQVKLCRVPGHGLWPCAGVTREAACCFARSACARLSPWFWRKQGEGQVEGNSRRDLSKPCRIASPCPDGPVASVTRSSWFIYIPWHDWQSQEVASTSFLTGYVKLANFKEGGD